MDIAEDKVNSPARPSKIGPGERLQAARIKQGLSVEDVAGRMHLSTSILESIEENNFDEITAPIFVKGYLRAYARIVALSEDEMIEQYIDMYSEEDPPISSTSNMVPELSVKDARIKWTTYLVILVLGVLLAAWWWNKQQNQEAPISLDAQTSAVDESAGADAPVVGSEIQAGSEIEIASTETGEASQAAVPDSGAPTPEATTEAVEDELPAADPVVTAAGETEPEPETSVELSEPVETAVPSESPEVTETQAEEPETAAGALARPDRSAPAGTDKLQIIVHADTWADVKDAGNYRLVYDLLRADSSMVLMGKAPFAVFLGNGHGVELLFNGEEIDITPKIRDDNTARLNVGG
jgi:cytoskeleton protein RodZ